MLYLQKWEANSFEYNFLNDIKLKVIDKKIYCGFDFGFFEGIVKKRDLKGGGGGELFAAHPKTAVFFPRPSHHTEDP